MTDNRTTELREKLTERGIKYRTTEVHGMPVTLYESGGCTWSVTDHPNGYMVVNCGNLTPEQAIAATLGGGDSSADDALALLDEIRGEGRMAYDDYSRLFDAIVAIGGVNSDGLPNGLTISDDGKLLNWRGENYVRQSALSGGECENVAQYPLHGFECSACGCTVEGRDELGVDIENGTWSYCPNCRAKVRKAVER